MESKYANSGMAKKYTDAIKAGTKTIEQVPARWRDQVLALLSE